MPLRWSLGFGILGYCYKHIAPLELELHSTHNILKISQVSKTCEIYSRITTATSRTAARATKATTATARGSGVATTATNFLTS